VLVVVYVLPLQCSWLHDLRHYNGWTARRSEAWASLAFSVQRSASDMQSSQRSGAL
jgi:hypothetical protein